MAEATPTHEGNLTVEQGKKETAPTFRNLRIPEGTSPELLQEARIIDSLLTGISLMRVHSLRLADKRFPDPDSSLPGQGMPEALGEEVKNEAQEMSNLRNTINELRVEGATDETLREEKIKAITTLANELLPLPDKKDEQAEEEKKILFTKETAAYLEKRIAHASHDIATPLTNIIGQFNLFKIRGGVYDSTFLSINNSLAKLDPTVRSFIESFSNTYRKESLALSNLQGFFSSQLMPIVREINFKKAVKGKLDEAQQIKLQVNIQEGIAKETIEASPEWLAILCTNLGQNFEKAFNRRDRETTRTDQKDVQITLGKSEDGKSIEIVYSDNGYGLPTKIEKERFIRGTTDWTGKEDLTEIEGIREELLRGEQLPLKEDEEKITGTGIGMASLTELFKDQYGATINPTAVRDPVTLKKRGTRIVIAFPMVDKSDQAA